MNNPSMLKPMPLSLAIFFFGIPALFIYFLIHVGAPFLLDTGVSMFWTFMIIFPLPLLFLFLAAIIAYRLEGHDWTWKSFKHRMRLEPMNGRAWLWTGGLFAVTLAGYFGLSFTSTWLASISFFAPPDYLAEIRTDETFAGIPLAGNWWLASYHLAILFFNVFGEELWFRGYIFPRQELSHGKRSWWIHGLLYNLFHIFWKWDQIRLLPESLSYGLVVRKTGTIWPCIISHLAFNGLGFIFTVRGIIQS